MTDFEHLKGTEWWSIAMDTKPHTMQWEYISALNDAYGLLDMGSEIIKARDARIAELELAIEYLEPNHRLLEDGDD